MKTLSTLLFTALVASSLMATPVLAAPPAGETEAPGQPFDHPTDDGSYSKDMRDDEMLAKSKPADNGTIQYVSGGVAVSGMRAIDAEEHNYNLKMLFVAARNGEYLSDVNVKITDSKGNSVLDTKTQGPVLLVKMPHGHYTVSTTTHSGKTLTRKIKVGDDYLASYVLRYPASKQ